MTSVQPVSYARLYTGDDGESHFADVDLRFESLPASWSKAIAEHTEKLTASEAFFRRVVGGDHTDGEPHVAPRRQLMIGLAGEAEVMAGDGEVRRFGPGSILLVEDVDGRGHWSWTIDGQPSISLVVVLEG